MANTYTQLYIQFVFAVQRRACVIQPEWEIELYKYITGITQNQKHKMIAINGMPDHIHIVVGLNPVQSISNLLQIVKGESSEWINKKGFVDGHFTWQEGYGAFSYCRRHLDEIYQYVKNQKIHHQKKTFLDEYTQLLEEFDVKYDNRYIFKPLI